MKKIKIAFSAAGSLFAPSFSRCLKENGEREVSLVGLDCNDDPTILQYCDEVFVTPKATEASYVDEVLNICKKCDVDVFIPYMSAELKSLLAKKPQFEECGIKLSIGTEKMIDCCTDKLKLYNLMLDNNIPTPRFIPFNTLDGFNAAVMGLGLPNEPVCVKAVGLSGSRGFRVISGKSRFDTFFSDKPSSVQTSYLDLFALLSERPDDIPQMMAMEYLPGEEFSVDVLADHGRIVYMCARQSNRIIASIPLEATLFDDNRAYEVCRRVAKHVELDGNADFDFRYNAKGEPMLLEINPRVAATMAVFREGGLNLPYLRVKQLLGEELPNVSVVKGKKMIRRYQEFYT